MKLAAFDLETAKAIPEGAAGRERGPLGIACAALTLSDRAEPIFWQGVPQMTKPQCQALVKALQGLVEDGWTLVTWNGCGFDFWVLAQESDMRVECAKLALAHVDLMLIVTFTKGWRLRLQKALEGAGLDGKLKSVMLSDGSVLDGMSGAKAPELWSNGHHAAVLSYLGHDAAQLLKLTQVILRERAIRWTSGSGRPWSLPIPRLLTVLDCFNLPRPDVSWMTDPPTRNQFVEWMFTQGALPDDGEYQISAADFKRLRERGDLGYRLNADAYWKTLLAAS